MSKVSKRIQKASELLDRNLKYPVEEAVDLVKKMATAKFDESVDIAISLGVNPKKADQMVRGSVVLPNGLGREKRVLVFAKGEKEKEALDAGADYAGCDDLVEKIKNGWLEFDAAVATPDTMGSVGKVGKILGPRGLMPNPKSGTVTFDLAHVIKEVKAGRIEFRTDKVGIVHASVGKAHFTADQLIGNIKAFMETIIKLKPATSKGQYVKRVSLSSTMSPGVKVDELKLVALARG